MLYTQEITHVDELGEFYTKYALAIDEIKSKLELLANELQTRMQHNPIYMVKSRLKTTSSIFNKLIRRGLEPNLISAKNNLTDIAGIKVVCDYIEDIYFIKDMLLSSKGELKIIKIADYIKNPKANGYRSLHIVVLVPVCVSGSTENIPVEIQMRSIAMDYWATLEHQICYKRGCDNVPDAIIKRLKDCAEIIASTDIKMRDINEDLEAICSLDVKLD